MFIVTIYSLIYFPGEEDIIALQEHDTSFDHEEPHLSEPLDHNFASSTAGQKRIKCHVCDDEECSPPYICEDAITVKTFTFSLTFCINFSFYNMSILDYNF